MLILLATQSKLKHVNKCGAPVPLQIPAGGIPWGDAVGWRDAPSSRRWHDGTAWPTQSTALDADGVPTMAAGEELAAQQRHGTIANDKPIYGLLFDERPRVVGADALIELTYVLAGVGCRPWQRQWSTWRQGGEGNPWPLQLRLQDHYPLNFHRGRPDITSCILGFIFN